MGGFIHEAGIVDADYQQKNKIFYEQYEMGKQDNIAFLKFCLEPLTSYSRSELDDFHQQFMKQKIEPIFLDKSQNAVDRHKEYGDTVLVITATNSFAAAPIVRAYGIEHLLTTEPEVESGRFTGNYLGTPCFQSGKIDNLMFWLEQNDETLDGSTFYSDSHNDLPMLKLVENPVAVNADPILRKTAQENGWRILDWM